ncbi:MAG: EAL domain-containing protein [Pseudomonadales bacterium]|nr:EAL domain-containing protein [Pseudomonadales bacterium]
MLEANLHLASKVFENSLDGIYITDQTGAIVQVNKAFCDITGYKTAVVLGKKPSKISAGWHDVNFLKDIQPALTEHDHWEGELVSRRENGEAFLAWMMISSVHNEQGIFQGLITAFRDITKAKHDEENIRKLAYYDPLTRLPNRSLFEDRLVQALHTGNRNRHYLAVLFLDLDGFKAVNDSFGHAVGDRLLTEVSRRLQSCIRSDDTVARMGGDEFTLLINALPDKVAAESASSHIANKIIKTLNRAFFIEGQSICVGVSIGIALYPEDGLSGVDLIKNADAAMYHAKNSGKNHYQYFTRDMHKRATQREDIEKHLCSAVANNEFMLDFQPKFDARDMQLKGFEALLRWNHPERGRLMPSAFMRSIEELGLGVEVGGWVINKACEQIKAWQNQGVATHNIAINVFPRHFSDGSLATVVEQALAHSEIAPNTLTLEFSDALISEDIGFSTAMLSSLHALGVRISIDDFATGMMSLAYLNRLPIDELKIDRQFIHLLDRDVNQWRIVDAIMGIASSFGCDVVAEGIERQDQLNLLMTTSCLRVQGFLFSKAMPAEEVQAYIENHESKKVVLSVD